MPYVAANYANNLLAPVNKWVCAPTSARGPFNTAPADHTSGLDLCGQCVSYVKKVCPSLASTKTSSWMKGKQVKGNTSIVAGTVIATFNSQARYEGHAAIYVSQDSTGIWVYDQYISGRSPKAIGIRQLKWGAHGVSNNGDLFFIVE